MLRRLLLISGFIALVLASNYIAERIRSPKPVESVRLHTPEWFNIVQYLPPDGIALLDFPNAQRNSQDARASSYTFPLEKVALLNKKLSQRYTGHGGTWEFAVLKQEANRQYIQVTTSGSSSILKCWYWATPDKVEPDKAQWITAGHAIEVAQLTMLFIGGGVLLYLIVRLLHRWVPTAG